MAQGPPKLPGTGTRTEGPEKTSPETNPPPVPKKNPVSHTPRTSDPRPPRNNLRPEATIAIILAFLLGAAILVFVLLNLYEQIQWSDQSQASSSPPMQASDESPVINLGEQSDNPTSGSETPKKDQNQNADNSESGSKQPDPESDTQGQANESPSNEAATNESTGDGENDATPTDEPSLNQPTGGTQGDAGNRKTATRTLYTRRDSRINLNDNNPFMVATESDSTVFVIDKSGSMQGRAFTQVRDSMLAAIHKLTPSQSFAIVFFDIMPTPMPGWKLKKATPSSVRLAENFAQSIRPDGGTNPTVAMDLAMKLIPSTIIVLSDGDFEQRLVNEISNMNQTNKITIHTIGLQNQIRTLQTLARKNGGTYTTAVVSGSP